MSYQHILEENWCATAIFQTVSMVHHGSFIINVIREERRFTSDFQSKKY